MDDFYNIINLLLTTSYLFFQSDIIKLISLSLKKNIIEELFEVLNSAYPPPPTASNGTFKSRMKRTHWP